MKRSLLLVALLAAGVTAAAAVAAVTTGTVSACATTPAQTIAVNGSNVATVPAESACATVTYTASTVTTTVIAPTTTATTTATTTTTPAPAGVTPGIGALNESGNLGSVTSPGIYSVLVGGAWGGDVSTVLEKAAGRGLAYFDGTDVRTSFSTGVPYTQASANGWLLAGASGSLLLNTQYGSYCADIGSSAYQQAWIANVENYLSSHVGVDGVFIDNVLYDPKADCGAYPAKYPTTAAWDTAMVVFVKAVYSALHANGFYVALNAGAYKSGDTAYNDGTSTVNWWRQVGPYASGLMNEYYDETSDGTYRVRTTGTAWYQSFDGWQRLIATAQGLGDDFLGLTKTAGLNTASATYGRASFLLEWDGRGSAYVYTCGNTCNPTSLSWTADLGQPLAPKIAVGGGYERAYAKGTVLVNPSPSSSQTFTVNGTGYTLAPATAKIVAG